LTPDENAKQTTTARTMKRSTSLTRRPNAISIGSSAFARRSPTCPTNRPTDRPRYVVDQAAERQLQRTEVRADGAEVDEFEDAEDVRRGEQRLGDQLRVERLPVGARRVARVQRL